MFAPLWAWLGCIVRTSFRVPTSTPHSKLNKHRSKGGMGYIDIKDYYIATILSKMREWTQPNPTTLWSDIENKETPGPNLTDWLFSTPTNNHQLQHYSLSVQASIKAWRIIHTKWFHLPTKPLPITITTLKHLTPDLILPHWISERFSLTQEIHNTTSNKSFPQVQKDYNAPTKDFLTYHRLQKCLASNPSLEGTLPTQMWDYFLSDNSKHKRSLPHPPTSTGKKTHFTNPSPYLTGKRI